MTIAETAKVLKQEDIAKILDNAMRILETVGVIVENDDMLKVFKEHGGCRAAGDRLFIDRKTIENLIGEADKRQAPPAKGEIKCFAGVYQGFYLTADGAYEPWTHARVLEYAKLAKHLPNITNMFMLGYPVEGTNDLLRPLYEKLYCWQYGINGGKAIWETSICPHIKDMWEIYAAEIRMPAKDIYNGTVYLISPLKFGKEEADQFMFFHRHGFQTTVGQLGTLGATTPVTFAGALSIHIAEGLFICLLNKIFFGTKTLHLYNSLSAMDMSTGIFQYGRPEQALLNTACAQVACAIGASFEGHGGLTDAKYPGYEAAGQKVYSAVNAMLAYGQGILEAGLLSVDEVCSPIQMILDDEMAGAIKKTTEPIVVNEETLAFDVIREAGPGGNFLDMEHTFEHFRQALWFPETWSKESFNMWEDKKRPTELSRAKEKFYAIMEKEDLPPLISDETERALRRVINSVERR